MPRRPGLWERAGRGWYTTINGRQVPLGATRAEAEVAFARLLLGRGGSLPSIRLAELTQLWLDQRRETCARTSWVLARRFAQVWCKRLGRLKASDLKPYHASQWIASEATWNATSRCMALRLLKRCLSWGCEQGYLEEHPLAKLKVAGGLRREPVSEDDFAKWYAAIDRPELRLWVDLSLATGCRPGELAGLAACHLAREGHSTPRHATISGKTGKRTVPLSDATGAILERLARERPEGPLLRGPDGRTPWNKWSLGWYFRLVSNSCGVKVVPYHLRHVFATRSLRVNGEVITAKLLGHRGLSMLAGHYEGLEADDLRAAAERVMARQTGGADR